MEAFSTLLTICAPHKEPVMQALCVYNVAQAVKQTVEWSVIWEIHVTSS